MRQISPRTNRIVLVVWMSLVIVMSGFMVAGVIHQWPDVPWPAIGGAVLVGCCGLYAIVGLVMLAIDKHVFD